MTYDELAAMLEETNLPLAYDHFEEGASPDPPFLIFLFPGSDNFMADGKVYKNVDELHVELYTDRKQPYVEARVESVLDSHDLAYNKTEVWIPDEKLYEVLYTMGVMIDVEEKQDQI